jgi:hypothetical protein
MVNLKTLGLLSLAAALHGCGGGRSDQPATAVLKLSTQGSVAAQSIQGVELTITLPAGVTVAAGSTGKPDDGVLAPSGVAAGGSVSVAGRYTAATSSTPGTVRLVLLKTAGFDAGEFAMVTCSIAPGSAPRSADFGLAGFKAVDQNGAAIDALGATLSVVRR